MKLNKLIIALILFGINLAQAQSQLDTASMLRVMQSRTYKGKSIKAFIGFVDVVEGAENLLNEDDIDKIQNLQRVMEGVTSLIETSRGNAPISIEEQVHINKLIDEFRLNVELLIDQNITRAIDDNHIDNEAERKKLIEGLSIILYNVVYILIDSKSMNSCLANMLGGVYKVISAVLADGKVGRADWKLLLRALASIFTLGQVRTAP